MSTTATSGLSFGSPQTITVALTGLTTGSSRQSTSFSNTTLLAPDYELQVQTKYSANNPTGTLDVFVAPKVDTGVYTDGCTGTDGTFTTANRRNAIWVLSVTLSNNLASPAATMLAQWLGGKIPDDFALIFTNNGGNSLSGTGADHVVKLLPVYTTATVP
jgi:hypothetical protein